MDNVIDFNRYKERLAEKKAQTQLNKKNAYGTLIDEDIKSLLDEKIDNQEVRSLIHLIINSVTDQAKKENTTFNKKIPQLRIAMLVLGILMLTKTYGADKIRNEWSGLEYHRKLIEDMVLNSPLC